MNNREIYYFSGTGNSWWLPEILQKGLMEI